MSAMSVDYFFSKDMRHQLGWLYIEGECLVSVADRAYKVSLFCLRDFLVEVFYDIETDQELKIEHFNMQKCPRTNKYLQEIKLPGEFEKLTMD